MFATNSYLNYSTYTQTETARALHQYRLARIRGWLNQRWAALIRRSRNLRELSTVASETATGGRHFAGTHVVSIHQIRGTEGRSHDFDTDFNPLSDYTKDRWLSVFTVWQKGVALPPVELIRSGDTYFVRDGHHRISVARALGQEYIDAMVTVWN